MVADPTPLGLAGFSSIVLMVSMHYAKIITSIGWIAPLGLMAGLSLLLGSIYHFISNNTIPATTFGIYGTFWLSVAILVFTNLVSLDKLDGTITYMRICVAIFTFYVWIVSFFISKVSLCIFTTLECKLIFFISGYFSQNDTIYMIGGCFGIICALLGFYTSASLLLKPFIYLPLGKPVLKSRIVPN